MMRASTWRHRDSITADVEVPEGGAEDPIHLGRTLRGPWCYLIDGKPMFLWNLIDLSCVTWEGSEALSLGQYRIQFDFALEQELLCDLTIVGYGTRNFRAVDHLSTV